MLILQGVEHSDEQRIYLGQEILGGHVLKSITNPTLFSEKEEAKMFFTDEANLRLYQEVSKILLGTIVPKANLNSLVLSINICQYLCNKLQ